MTRDHTSRISRRLPELACWRAGRFGQTDTQLITRAIPSSGERLPAVGLGTAYVFDRDNDATRAQAAAVVQALVANGGRLIDTASTYGDAEIVLGDVIAAAGLRDKLFIATKLEEPDAAELKRSLTRLKTAKVDLLQLHNVRNPQGNRWRSSRSGRRKASAATSASPRPFMAISRRSRRCSGARSRISCRSTIRSTTARRKSASCRWPPRSRPAC